MRFTHLTDPIFKIYFDGPDLCVELINGKWHVAVQESEDETIIEERDEKPDRFVDYEFLTMQEIYDRGFFILIIDRYCGYSILEGAENLSEVIDRLLAEVKHIGLLEEKGWEIAEAIENGHTDLLMEPKPYDQEDNLNDNS